jgi:hypothetical protein
LACLLADRSHAADVPAVGIAAGVVGVDRPVREDRVTYGRITIG